MAKTKRAKWPLGDNWRAFFLPLMLLREMGRRHGHGKPPIGREKWPPRGHFFLRPPRWPT